VACFSAHLFYTLELICQPREHLPSREVCLLPAIHKTTVGATAKEGEGLLLTCSKEERLEFGVTYVRLVLVAGSPH